MTDSFEHYLVHKRILLGVTGGIAAYKAAELLRRFQDHGAEVRVVMTQGATQFITPLTMQALSGHPVHLDLLDTEAESAMGHIELARWADLILIAPASANFIAKYCGGHADDLLSTICVAAECKIAIAPAMNQAMWADPHTQANIQSLKESSVTLLGPEAGIQACGEVGEGRLLDINAIIQQSASLFSTGKLAGKKVVITAGPTREAIDPVRYISNHSSGKQGYALAQSALEAGAEVVLVSGPTKLSPPERARCINITSADDMLSAVMAEISDCDIFIGVAAVADFKPVVLAEQKIKKKADADNQTMSIELVQNPDIIATVANLEAKPFTVGFAAETENLEEQAKQKLLRKKLDMIIANNVAKNNIGFNSDDNEVSVFWEGDHSHLPIMSKQDVSDRIINFISEHLSRQS